MARHFLDGDAPEKALTYSLMAGADASRLHAHRDAVAHFETAVELSRELEDASAMRSALEHLGAALLATGDYTRAIEILERAAAAYRDVPDFEGELRCVARIGSSHAWRGTGILGAERLEAVTARIPRDTRSEAAVLVFISLASVLFVAGRVQAQYEAAETAAEIAHRIGADRLVGQAEGRRGLALNLLHRYDEALVAFDLAISVGEKFQDLDSLQRAYQNSGLTLLALGQNDLAMERLHKATASAMQSRSAGGAMLAVSSQAFEAFLGGDWAAARRHISELVGGGPTGDPAGPGASRQTTEASLFLACLDFLETGSRESVERLKYFDRLASEIGNSQLAANAVVWLCLDDLWENRPDDLLQRTEEAARRWPGSVTGMLVSTILVALAQVKQGRPEEAMRLLDSPKANATTPPEHALALYARGSVLRGLGRAEEAITTLTEAIQNLSGLNRFFQALAQEELAAAYWDRGSIDEAHAVAASALAQYQTMGAAPSAARVRAVMAQFSSGLLPGNDRLQPHHR